MPCITDIQLRENYASAMLLLYSTWPLSISLNTESPRKGVYDMQLYCWLWSNEWHVLKNIYHLQYSVLLVSLLKTWILVDIDHSSSPSRSMLAIEGTGASSVELQWLVSGDHHGIQVTYLARVYRSVIIKWYALGCWASIKFKVPMCPLYASEYVSAEKSVAWWMPVRHSRMAAYSWDI